MTGRNIKVIECDRRPGDPPVLVGSSGLARQVLGWEPRIQIYVTSLSTLGSGIKSNMAKAELNICIMLAYGT